MTIGVTPVFPPLTANAYTLWRTRVLAFLIDWGPIWLVFAIPLIGVPITDDAACLEPMYGDGQDLCTTPTAELWFNVQVFGLVPVAVYFFWNFCYRQGRTGQSIGKSALRFMVVSEKTGKPIGFWLSLVRQLAHYVDQAICYVGYLWPLWDGKRQTIADKVMGTVCVPVATVPGAGENQAPRKL